MDKAPTETHQRCDEEDFVTARKERVEQQHNEGMGLTDQDPMEECSRFLGVGKRGVEPETTQSVHSLMISNYDDKSFKVPTEPGGGGQGDGLDLQGVSEKQEQLNSQQSCLPSPPATNVEVQ